MNELRWYVLATGPLLMVTLMAPPPVDWSASNELLATLTVWMASIAGMYCTTSVELKHRVPAPSMRVSLILVFPPLTLNERARVGLTANE